MKKYLLSLLVVGLSFVGFSNAKDFTVNCSYHSCPVVDFGGVYTIDSFSYSINSCNNGDVDIDFNFYNGGSAFKGVGSPNGECSKTYTFDESFESDSLNLGFYVRPDSDFVINLSVGGVPDGGENGGESGGDSDSELIGQLSPVVEGLENTITEFIPYVVYIGLGILSVIIGFVAIKRLINRTKGKSLGVFSSRRKRK